MKTRTVSARVPAYVHEQMLAEIETKGLNMSDLVREAWAYQQQGQTAQQQLHSQERRLKAQVFEMLTTCLSLTTEERQHALSQLKAKGVTW